MVARINRLRLPVQILTLAVHAPVTLEQAPTPSATVPDGPEVKTLDDANDGVFDSTSCSLREAIANAPAGTRVRFAAGLIYARHGEHALLDAGLAALDIREEADAMLHPG